MHIPLIFSQLIPCHPDLNLTVSPLRSYSLTTQFKRVVHHHPFLMLYSVLVTPDSFLLYLSMCTLCLSPNWEPREVGTSPVMLSALPPASNTAPGSAPVPGHQDMVIVSSQLFSLPPITHPISPRPWPFPKAQGPHSEDQGPDYVRA